LSTRLDAAPQKPHARRYQQLFFLLTYLNTYTLQVVQSKDACSGWARARPISGSMSCCRRCSRRCVTSAMPPPAPSRRSRAGWVCRLGVPEAVAVSAASPEEPRPVSPPLAAPVGIAIAARSHASAPATTANAIRSGTTPAQRRATVAQQMGSEAGAAYRVSPANRRTSGPA
jgi:hypothetical protein